LFGHSLLDVQLTKNKSHIGFYRSTAAAAAHKPLSTKLLIRQVAPIETQIFPILLQQLLT